MAGLDLVLPSIDAVPEWVAGQYYDLTNTWPAVSIGGQAATADTIYTSPLWVPYGGRLVDRLAINITLAAGAGNKARVGIIRKAIGSPLPGALLLDGGEVAIDALGAVAATIDLWLPGPALYHVAFHPQANCSITGYAMITGIYGAGGGGVADQQRMTAVMTQSYGPLPATFSATSYSAAVRRVMVRAA